VVAVDRRGVNHEILNVPQEVRDVQEARALTTLPVERFFPLMRKNFPIPYALQYMQSRTRAVHEAVKQVNATGFNYFTGDRKSDRHYTTSGSEAVRTVHRVDKIHFRASRSAKKKEGTEIDISQLQQCEYK
jgi:hypothetical protein